MASRLALGIAATMFAFLRPEPSAEAQKNEIPFKLENNLILVEGSIGKARLRFLIDTGATRTVIDKRLVKRLGLRPEPEEYWGRAFGGRTKSRKVMVSGLRLGPFLTNMNCFEADLSGLNLNVDGVIGLDLMRHATGALIDSVAQQLPKKSGLTIDYESGKIRFGQTESFEGEAAMETGETGILLAVKVQDQQLRLVLDTGAQITTLFRGRQTRWIDRLPTVSMVPGFHLGGGDFTRQVLLQRLELGTSKWRDLPGCVLEAQDQPADGVLAIAPLNLKALHLDFERNVVSWRK